MEEGTTREDKGEGGKDEGDGENIGEGKKHAHKEGQCKGKGKKELLAPMFGFKIRIVFGIDDRVTSILNGLLKIGKGGGRSFDGGFFGGVIDRGSFDSWGRL